MHNIIKGGKILVLFKKSNKHFFWLIPSTAPGWNKKTRQKGSL